MAEKLTKPVKICNDKYMLNVSRDRLTAVIKLYEAESFAAGDYDDILREVQSYGIVFGFLPKLSPPVRDMVVIARGKPAVQGENARLLTKVRPALISSRSVEKRAKDKVDFRELGKIVNVPSGQLLIEKISPKPGSPGKNVYGEEIFARTGKDIKVKCGKGVVISKDGLKVLSTVEGKFVMDDGRPAVLEEHEINGDVDISVGNIVFCGKSLLVSGEVMPGFKLKCKGDITVQGGVNNANIIAGGKLEINGGLIGEDSNIRVKGNAKVDFIENIGSFETRGQLTVSDFIVQGNIKTAGDLIALEGKGAVIGGTYVLGGSMHVKELGSDAEVVTAITVGLNPDLEARKKKIEAEKEIWPPKMNELLKNIGVLNEMKKKEGADFPTDKKELLQKLNKMMPEVMEKTNELTEQEAQLDEDMLKASGESVFVYGILYPGVFVKIGKAQRVITDEESFVVIELHRQNQQIHVRSMTADEKEAINLPR
jgi:uncharacterized protein (DUF342 family)